MHLRLRHFLLLFISVPAFAQTPKTELHFTSSVQQKITVFKGTIFVNGNRAYQLPADAIVYSSRRNKLVEDKNNVFLFLEINGAPKKNRLYVFGINNSKADSLLEAVSSDVKDWDHDGLLEFGGAEAAAVYPAADSVYYIPSKFYEINKGRIVFDPVYTEKVDKKANGVYIPDATADKVIPKPKGRP